MQSEKDGIPVTFPPQPWTAKPVDRSLWYMMPNKDQEMGVSVDPPQSKKTNEESVSKEGYVIL